MLTNSTVQAGGFPKLAGAAAGVALLLALYGFVSAFHHVFLLFSAIVPAIAAFSILQRRVWGAYGFALFELVQATVVLLLLRSTSIAATQIAAAVIMGFG
ncbi:MAG: hypothetical protein JO061_22365, partial [Acidobacteriaceae bacterium]|nr:hypothetical protein [Acidobacteriaceae bacterium]